MQAIIGTITHPELALLSCVDLKVKWDGTTEHAAHVDISMKLEANPNSSYLILDASLPPLQTAKVTSIRFEDTQDEFSDSVSSDAGSVKRTRLIDIQRVRQQSGNLVVGEAAKNKNDKGSTAKRTTTDLGNHLVMPIDDNQHTFPTQQTRKTRHVDVGENIPNAHSETLQDAIDPSIHLSRRDKNVSSLGYSETVQTVPLRCLGADVSCSGETTEIDLPTPPASNRSSLVLESPEYTIVVGMPYKENQLVELPAYDRPVTPSCRPSDSDKEVSSALRRSGSPSKLPQEGDISDNSQRLTLPRQQSSSPNHKRLHESSTTLFTNGKPPWRSPALADLSSSPKLPATVIWKRSPKLPKARAMAGASTTLLNRTARLQHSRRVSKSLEFAPGRTANAIKDLACLHKSLREKERGTKYRSHSKRSIRQTSTASSIDYHQLTRTSSPNLRTGQEPARGGGKARPNINGKGVTNAITSIPAVDTPTSPTDSFVSREEENISSPHLTNASPNVTSPDYSPAVSPRDWLAGRGTSNAYYLGNPIQPLTIHEMPTWTLQNGKMILQCGPSVKAGVYALSLEIEMVLTESDLRGWQELCIPAFTYSMEHCTGAIEFSLVPDPKKPCSRDVEIDHDDLQTVIIQDFSHFRGTFDTNRLFAIRIRCKQALYRVPVFNLHSEASITLIRLGPSQVKATYAFHLRTELLEEDIFADQVEYSFVLRNGGLKTFGSKLEPGVSEITAVRTGRLPSADIEKEVSFTVIRAREDVDQAFDFCFSVVYDKLVAKASIPLRLPTIRPSYGAVIDETLLLWRPLSPLVLKITPGSLLSTWSMQGNDEDESLKQIIQFERKKMPHTFPERLQDDVLVKISEIPIVRFHDLPSVAMSLDPTSSDATRLYEEDPGSNVVHHLAYEIYESFGSDGRLECDLSFTVPITKLAKVISINAQGWIPSVAFTNGKLVSTATAEWRMTSDGFLTLFKPPSTPTGTLLHIEIAFHTEPDPHENVRLDGNPFDGEKWAIFDIVHSPEYNLPRIVGKPILRATFVSTLEGCTLHVRHPEEVGITDKAEESLELDISSKLLRADENKKLRVPVLKPGYSLAITIHKNLDDITTKAGGSIRSSDEWSDTDGTESDKENPLIVSLPVTPQQDTPEPILRRAATEPVKPTGRVRFQLAGDKALLKKAIENSVMENVESCQLISDEGDVLKSTVPSATNEPAIPTQDTGMVEVVKIQLQNHKNPEQSPPSIPKDVESDFDPDISLDILELGPPALEDPPSLKETLRTKSSPYSRFSIRRKLCYALFAASLYPTLMLLPGMTIRGNPWSLGLTGSFTGLTWGWTANSDSQNSPSTAHVGESVSNTRDKYNSQGYAPSEISDKQESQGKNKPALSSSSAPDFISRFIAPDENDEEVSIYGLPTILDVASQDHVRKFEHDDKESGIPRGKGTWLDVLDRALGWKG
ncbi:hypothetical protein MMC25_005873 [Agyrium rufum]|nr:hypothetical protein [Agyrium rufum]